LGVALDAVDTGESGTRVGDGDVAVSVDDEGYELSLNDVNCDEFWAPTAPVAVVGVDNGGTVLTAPAVVLSLTTFANVCLCGDCLPAGAVVVPPVAS